MTKTKGFWAILAIISLAAAVFSAHSIYTRLTVHFSNDTLEIGRDSVPPLPDPEEPEEAAAADTEADPPPVPEPLADMAAQSRPRAMKTLFEYKDPSARHVSLVGSFTSWKEIPLAKKNGVWKADVYILPGSYLYHFLVDGKKTPDPSKPRSPLGESIVTVGDAYGQN